MPQPPLQHPWGPPSGGWRLPPDSPLVLESRRSGRLEIVSISPLSVGVVARDQAPTGPVTLVHAQTGEVFDTWSVRVLEAGGEDYTLQLDASPQGLDRRLALLLTLEEAGLIVQPGSRQVPPEEVRDGRRILQVLRSLAKEGRPVRVAGGQGEPCNATLKEVTEAGLVWVTEGCPEPPVRIHLAGYASAYSFQAGEAEAHPDGFTTPLPRQLTRTRTRRHRREAPPPGTTLRFVHPLLAGRVLEIEVLDLSVSGLALRGPPDEAMLFPGLALPQATVRLPDGAEHHLALAVRQVRSDRVGLEILAEHGEPTLTWPDRVLAIQNPRCGVGSVSPEAMWELFVHSGYFQIGERGSPHVDETRHRFSRAYDRARRAPHLAAHVAWPSSRGNEATVTVLKAYSGGWLPTHLARRPGEKALGLDGRQILRETMLRGYEHMLRDPECRYLIHWTHVDARFGSYVAYELGARLAREFPQVTVRPFRAWAGLTDHERLTPQTFEIVEAGPELYPRIEAVIRRDRSDTFAEAHDLVPERMDLRGIKAQWAEAGLDRDRRILAARSKGRVVAFAVLESGQDALHVWGFLDLVRTFALEPGGEAAFGDLLEAARQWYRDLGRFRFTYFQEVDWDLSPHDLEDLGKANLSILPAEFLPEQLQHIWEITSPSGRHKGMGHAA